MNQSEHILVVPRTLLFSQGENLYGIKEGSCDNYLDLIMSHKEFHERSLMETDARYKQIIPYLVFTHEGKYFVMQRKATASETRLQSKFTLGIGGHIRQEDMQHNSIIEWAQREFDEEVYYEGSYTIEPIGIINDDTNPVGQVHVGFLFLLHGDSPSIAVKSELQSGQLMSLEDCVLLQEKMETWSSFVVDYLVKNS